MAGISAGIDHEWSLFRSSNNTSVLSLAKFLHKRPDVLEEGVIAEYSALEAMKLVRESCNRLTEWHLIQRKSSSVLSSLGTLSIRRMATHIVVGLAVATGLHLTARSWRKLVSKSELKVPHIGIERQEGISYRASVMLATVELSMYHKA